LPEDDAASEPLSPFAGGKPITESAHNLAEDLHDWILGGQDGLVNVLGTILGIAVVTSDKTILIVGGLAAAFAEAISISAVAFTSVKASISYYDSELFRQRIHIRENPELARAVLVDAYERKGLKRHDAHRIVTELTHDENVWLEMIMSEHLHMHKPESMNPLRSATIVGVSATFGSLIPLIPFFFLIGYNAIFTSLLVSAVILFIGGAASAKLTIGNWKVRGLEMATIGIIAAVVGFGIGLLFTSGIITIG